MKEHLYLTSKIGLGEGRPDITAVSDFLANLSAREPETDKRGRDGQGYEHDGSFRDRRAEIGRSHEHEARHYRGSKVEQVRRRPGASCRDPVVQAIGHGLEKPGQQKGIRIGHDAVPGAEWWHAAGTTYHGADRSQTRYLPHATYSPNRNMIPLTGCRIRGRGRRHGAGRHGQACG